MENVKPFKEMSLTEKKNHIVDYYKWHIIIAAVLIFFVGSILHDILSKKDDLLSVLFINYPTESTEENCEEYFEEFVHQIGGNTDKEQIAVDTSLALNVNSDASFQQIYILNTLIVSGTYTGFFSDEDTFMYNAKQDTFQSLSEYLSDDVLEAYGDAVIYTTSEEFHETYPCGIHLTRDNNEWLAQNSNYDSCYFGLCFSEADEALVQQFTKFLIEDHMKTK